MKYLILYSAKLRSKLEQKYFPYGATYEQTKLLDEVQELLSLMYQAGKNDTEDVAKNAYLGYLVNAAERMKLDSDRIERLISLICLQLDKSSLEQSAKQYKNSSYFCGKKG